MESCEVYLHPEWMSRDTGHHSIVDVIGFLELGLEDEIKPSHEWLWRPEALHIHVQIQATICMQDEWSNGITCNPSI